MEEVVEKEAYLLFFGRHFCWIAGSSWGQLAYWPLSFSFGVPALFLCGYSIVLEQS